MFCFFVHVSLRCIRTNNQSENVCQSERYPLSVPLSITVQLQWQLPAYQISASADAVQGFLWSHMVPSSVPQGCSRSLDGLQRGRYGDRVGGAVIFGILCYIRNTSNAQAIKVLVDDKKGPFFLGGGEDG